MLLLDELRDHGPEHVTCGVIIQPQPMFCDGSNGVPAWVGSRCMAQAVCAFSGIEKCAPGCRPASACCWARAPTSRRCHSSGWEPTLTIRADLLLRDESDLVAFACTIHERDQLLARGEVKGFRPKDVLALILRFTVTDAEVEVFS